MKRREHCRKYRHKTYEGAVITLKRIKNKQLNVYRCSACNGAWHLGNSSNPFRIIQRIDQLLKEPKK
jgi:hypothetical protein